MKTYYSNEEVKRDINNGVLAIDDDIEIAFDGFSIDADIKCFYIYSKALNINALNINAWNINARNINAWNINAWDINARDINARDINYYAVCFAYQNIKCQSIKGRREGARHFCLDGEIIIKEEEIEELTMEEVCARLGKQIKIKK